MISKVYTFFNIYILSIIENIFVLLFPQIKKNNAPKIFILGVPRSGTTFITQCILNKYKFNYFSNLHSLLYGSPFIVSLLFKLFPPIRLETDSMYGNTKGFLGPSECGRWWYRFFKSGSFDDLQLPLSGSTLNKFRNSLNLMSLFNQKPVLMKNLYASYRVRSIEAAFHNTYYIIISRNSTSTINSLLNARKNNGSMEKWWSMPIPNACSNKSPLQQVTLQEKFLTSYVREQVSGIQENHICKLKYEEILENPSSFYSKLDVFFKSHNLI